MEHKYCAYFVKEPDLISDFGTCNLFPIETKVETRFIACETIPISKCPYKMFIAKKIDMEELHRRVMKILDKKAGNNDR